MRQSALSLWPWWTKAARCQCPDLYIFYYPRDEYCCCLLSVFHPETSCQLSVRPAWEPTVLNYPKKNYIPAVFKVSQPRCGALCSQFWLREFIFSPSPNVDTRESIPIRTHFIARYRFPLQCHAPRHTAAVQYEAHCFLSLCLPCSIFSLPLITHGTVFKGNVVHSTGRISQAPLL